LLRNNETIFDVVRTIKSVDTSFSSSKFPGGKLSITSKSGELLKVIYDGLRSEGWILFRESFELANKYLDDHLIVKDIISNRFKFVFIDEMQDLKKYQIDLLEKVFHNGCGKTVIQRVGDINQAIYSSGNSVKVEADWIPRNPMYINGSNRLTNEVARVVNLFTLDPQKDCNGNPKFVVKGQRKLSKIIRPQLILFDSSSTYKLEPAFIKLIEDYSLNGTKEGQKYGFSIIGWNGKWNDGELHDNKLRLENIFPNYKKRETASRKENFNSLCEHLQLLDKTDKTLANAKAAILGALVTVLNYEGVTFISYLRGKQIKRQYNKQELEKNIRDRENDLDYELFKSKLFKWSFSLMTEENYSNVYDSLKSFILIEFKIWFNLLIKDETKSFLGVEFEELIVNKSEKVIEKQRGKEIKINIGTVHSAKGKTHCATMYIETFYRGYETSKIQVRSKNATKTRPEILLPNPILGQEHNYRTAKDIRAKETLKMMYVGFSRPTHLLCFAVLKVNLENQLERLEKDWDITDITRENETT